MGLFVRSYSDPWMGLGRNAFYTLELQNLELGEGFIFFFQIQATTGGHRTQVVLIANVIYGTPSVFSYIL